MISEKLREIREGTGMNKKEFSEYLNLKYTRITTTKLVLENQHLIF